MTFYIKQLDPSSGAACASPQTCISVLCKETHKHTLKIKYNPYCHNKVNAAIF